MVGSRFPRLMCRRLKRLCHPRTALRNGSANVSVARSESKPSDRARAVSGRRRLAAIGLLGLAQAAAVLLVVGLACVAFSFLLSPAQNRIAIASLPNVEIEEGHLVVIVADPQNLGVVDLTPKGMAAGDGFVCGLVWRREVFRLGLGLSRD